MITTQTLLNEISDPKILRKDVATTYRLALQSSEATDWKAVNKAIIERWSFSALEWIKKQAWSSDATISSFVSRREDLSNNPARK